VEPGGGKAEKLQPSLYQRVIHAGRELEGGDKKKREESAAKIGHENGKRNVDDTGNLEKKSGQKGEDRHCRRSAYNVGGEKKERVNLALRTKQAKRGLPKRTAYRSQLRGGGIENIFTPPEKG